MEYPHASRLLSFSAIQFLYSIDQLDGETKFGPLNPNCKVQARDRLSQHVADSHNQTFECCHNSLICGREKVKTRLLHSATRGVEQRHRQGSIGTLDLSLKNKFEGLAGLLTRIETTHQRSVFQKTYSYLQRGNNEWSTTVESNLIHTVCSLLLWTHPFEIPCKQHPARFIPSSRMTVQKICSWAFLALSWEERGLPSVTFARIRTLERQ